ncbi:DUF4232 domain-containing protein [Streptomyces sp. R302]|uniref:DUF4232 domain-containing protein n=1 Tax=unclassified Streptomyces TaxID=2593676 RepID=UPI00145EAC61|nr:MULTISPECIES: DUF4232 domain-containing protein [unclassified Streptomyces]NML53195.1 DUF4232 domain-containing protein [Streptomyces sp. R301]NML82878.1 DUF4232 domain-containing protein [Streptomyces sp. R302]
MNSTTVRARSGRRGLRAAVLGAAVVAALLTTTACQNEDDGAKGTASPTGTPKTTAPAAPTTDSGTGSKSPTATATENGDSGETGGGNGTEYADCEAAGLGTHVELQDEPGQTPRHFLLTVTNRSKTPCVLNEAPILRLKAGDSAPIVRTLGEPDDEPVVVEGGGKAYTGLYVFGNDEGGEAEYDQSDRFTATLVAGEGTELSGTLVFDLPDGLGTVSVDDAARINGWAGTEGLAMRPITQLRPNG